MSPNNVYREKAREEVLSRIDLSLPGDLRCKFWYIDSVRRDGDGSWHVVLSEEQILYSATRLLKNEDAPESDTDGVPSSIDEMSFADLGLRCDAVLDEVKRALKEYLSSSGEGRLKGLRVSVGESTYRMLNAERLEAWQRDPRRFLAEYTLIETGMRDKICESEDD